MNNNDIMRRLRYTFDFNDDKMIDLFAQADTIVTRAEISDWLKKDDDPEQKSLHDKSLAIFLNGLINDRRGKRETSSASASTMKPEKTLNNNIIFRKLRIALSLKDEEILEILMLADFRFSKTELSAFFRDPNHQHYRQCKDQILRNFLHGLQIKHKPASKKTMENLAD